MTESHAKFGGVSVHFRPDGTLSIYQPDSNRVLAVDLARDLASFLMNGLWDLDFTEVPDYGTVEVPQGALETARRTSQLVGEYIRDHATELVESVQVTVPGGVIATSDGPVELTATDLEADKNAREAREALASTPDAKPSTAAEQPVADDSSRSRESTPVVKRRPGRPRKTT